MKFAFITEEKVAFPVAALCRLLVVSPSGYYAAQGRPRSQHACRDERLAEQVTEAHVASKRRYGSPRIHAEIKAAGERVGRKRVARLMRERKLAARTRRRFRTTTDSKHDFPVAPNVCPRSGMGHGHHLRLDGTGLAVPGGDPGPVLAARGGLVDQLLPRDLYE